MTVAAITKPRSKAKAFILEVLDSAAQVDTPAVGTKALFALEDGSVATKNSSGTVLAGFAQSNTVQEVNPAADSGVGSVILPASTSVDVGTVVNDADDWVVLPAIAGVGIGHTITIACNAGTNFELRTPATSGTKINNLDSDGTKEYLCTDTDTVVVRKQATDNWIATSFTNLGAVRAAVVPD